MHRVHIECAKCRKDVSVALWIRDEENFTNTPYCSECYMDIKEKEYGNQPSDKGRPGSDGIQADGADKGTTKPKESRTWFVIS